MSERRRTDLIVVPTSKVRAPWEAIRSRSPYCLMQWIGVGDVWMLKGHGTKAQMLKLREEFEETPQAPPSTVVRSVPRESLRLEGGLFDYEKDGETITNLDPRWLQREWIAWYLSRTQEA